jgi:hypothetical protein
MARLVRVVQLDQPASTHERWGMVATNRGSRSLVAPSREAVISQR